ncbi:hypothetical protein FQN54_000912 [Arachnomyces sp. PD_36]|nr:hypothetical protein FQN54_000912 [Arachnomyces sp. PD_36]
MKSTGLLGGVVALTACAQGVLAQQAEQGTYTDPDTGIIFQTNTFDNTVTEGGFTWGWALPEDAADAPATEYLGYVVGAINNGSGWSGVSHGGSMPESLLLLSWADGEEVKTSFRYATGYVAPDLYTGNATITPISSSVTETNFELIYRCQDCWSWSQGGAAGGQDTSEGGLLIGWVQSSASPEDPTDADSPISYHDNGFGLFQAESGKAAQAEYDSWVQAA